MAVLQAALSLILGVLLSPSAYAQEKDELARRHFESGAAYFAEAEYEEALKAFHKAYELSERPQILLNIAVVRERLGNLSEAVEALDQYIAANPGDPELETVRLRRDNLQKRAESEREALETPRPAAAPTTSVQPPPAAAAPPGPVDQPPGQDAEPNLLPAYLAISVGGLAAVGALVTGLGAKAEYDELESACSPGCSNDETSTGETLALTSTVLSGVALLGVGVGTYLWLSADGPAETVGGGKPNLVVGLGPSGGYAEAKWRF